MPSAVWTRALRTVCLVFATSLAATARGEEPKPPAKTPPEKPAAAKPKSVSADHAQKMAAGLKLFREQVGPLLASRCVECHGGDAVESEFDLSSRENLLLGGSRGKAVVIGKPKLSLLYQTAAHEKEPHMPDGGERLTRQELAAVARWIELGAPYDKPLVEEVRDPAAWRHRKIAEKDRDFWSLRPLANVQPPALEDPWIRNDIDRFVLRKLREHKLAANASAERRVLIRRAYFALVGLPPKPEEVEAFLTDKDPKAYEKLINRLLASPHYGERWARHWLDVARFAESHGFEQDYDRKHAYHYRDFVIAALNRDMPYDQFVQWQLAGDELAPNDPLAMMATGFLGAGAFPTQLTEKEFESARYDELDDMVATTGTAMLGLTFGCARCHDHKYDPIPQGDYYRLVATFATAIRSEIDLELPAEFRGGKPGKAKVMVTSEGLKPMKHHADGRGFPHFYKQTYYLKRGDANQKQGVAAMGFPQALTDPGQPTERWVTPSPTGSRTSHRRSGLARWITDTEHGAGRLLARVIANRVWALHFGRGLVSTPNDFGKQGERPTHPELLDWLARYLIEHEWRLKDLHRLILTSAAYRQSSQFDDARAKIDPATRWLWRFAPRRLEAEVIRDSLLAASGQLDPRMYGPGTLDPNHKRRSIYFMVKRSKLTPMMQIFDQPEPLVSVGRRPSTTIAPQALLLMNNPQVRGYASAMSARITGKAKDSIEAAIRHGYLLAVAREPTEAELKDNLAFIAEQEKSYAGAGKASQARQLALTDFCQVLMCLNEFVYVE